MAKRVRIQVMVSKYGKNGIVDKQLPTFELNCDVHGILLGNYQAGDFLKLSNSAYRLVLDIVDPLRVMDHQDIIAFVVE